jgi:hypothetical protein
VRGHLALAAGGGGGEEEGRKRAESRDGVEVFEERSQRIFISITTCALSPPELLPGGLQKPITFVCANNPATKASVQLVLHS